MTLLGGEVDWEGERIFGSNACSASANSQYLITSRLTSGESQRLPGATINDR